MFAENFSLPAYFARIGYTGPANADFETLSGIMRQQLYTVPFENLDVQAGKIVSLVPEQIVDKILHQPRGGYCYEVNGLFAMALAALGIPYRLVASRPMFYPTRRPRTHMVILAEVQGEQWLCDLGFGSYGIRQPLRVNGSGEPVEQDSDLFRLTQVSGVNGREYLLQAWVDGDWANQYAFDNYSQELIDFAPANYMNSTHPEAVFVQKPLIVLHNPHGRKILFGNSLKIVHNGQTRQQTFAPEDYAALLSEHFGLHLPTD